tara:strand:+ start:211 stop:1191 length:981 start_codon:yes stop_codon:yes gene_type:complete
MLKSERKSKRKFKIKSKIKSKRKYGKIRKNFSRKKYKSHRVNMSGGVLPGINKKDIRKYPRAKGRLIINREFPVDEFPGFEVVDEFTRNLGEDIGMDPYLTKEDVIKIREESIYSRWYLGPFDCDKIPKDLNNNYLEDTRVSDSGIEGSSSNPNVLIFSPEETYKLIPELNSSVAVELFLRDMVSTLDVRRPPDWGRKLRRKTTINKQLKGVSVDSCFIRINPEHIGSLINGSRDYHIKQEGDSNPIYIGTFNKKNFESIKPIRVIKTIGFKSRMQNLGVQGHSDFYCKILYNSEDHLITSMNRQLSIGEGSNTEKLIRAIMEVKY